MPTCSFNHQTFSFEGTAIEQSRCLLRKVLPLGNVSNTPANIPVVLQNMVGRPCDITQVQLADYLASQSIQATAIGGELDQPVSSTDGNAAPATSARYFVIHDTSFLHRPGRFTVASATFPASVNTAEWSGNNLSHAIGMTTHVMIARTGLSATSTNYRTRLRATKREKREYPGNEDALRGLFLHHELVQPRLRNMNDVDQFAPDPGFTPAQYSRLALCYIAAAVRSGTFLIPAFHCVLDLDITGGHDDPQKFDLDAWGIALGSLRSAITGAGDGVIEGVGGHGEVSFGHPPEHFAALEHGIINSPDGEANVRSGPSQGNEILAVLHNGEGVDIHARLGMWCRIAPSQEQWVHGSLVEIAGGGGGDLGDDAITRIKQIAAASSIARFDWPERGVAPIGYTKGMAVTFARAVCRLRARVPEFVEMAKAAAGSEEDDSLVYYRQKFAQLGMVNSVAGVDTLRHLFVLLLGLGMRESSGEHCCGRDTDAENHTGPTAEAGLFQTSWNARSEHDLMESLFNRYRESAETGFLDVFSEHVTCSADNWQNHGSGLGRIYQQLSKNCPAFHTEFTALAMRNTSQHWGPIINYAALLNETADQMFLEVQHFIESLGSDPF